MTNNQPLYSYYIFEFQGYDSDGASLYTQPDGSAGPLGSASKVLDKQALPKTNVGFSTSVAFGDWTMSTSFMVLSVTMSTTTRLMLIFSEGI